MIINLGVLEEIGICLREEWDTNQPIEARFGHIEDPIECVATWSIPYST